MSYLVGGEAQLVVDRHFEDGLRMLDAHHGRTAKVAVRIVAVPESQAVHASVALVVRRPVVQEAANAATLELVSLRQVWMSEVRTRPPCVSTTSAKPSNGPTV